jgi:myo-inositol-1(or 4)-monophosphatase
MGTSPLIRVITKAIEKARMPLLRDFGEVERLQISQKGTANFVSNADVRTEEMLIDELSYARKGWGFLTEEAGERDLDDCEFRFVIDPIDGTTNFIHAIPYFCVSIAAQKRIGEDAYETIAGVIVDPVHDEVFVAELGEGATVNHKKLQVTGARDHLMTATSAPRAGRADFEAAQAAMQRVAASGATVRCAGAAALDLAYVAAGRYDAIWYHQLKPWDTAAGALLVQEAGGFVGHLTDASGAPLEASILASSAASQTRIAALLQPK